jgi:glycosyltransferase involved in cell wall biosynthesis
LDRTEFGWIEIDGLRYEHDVLVRRHGTVEKRKKKLSKRVYGSSHTISLDESKHIREKGASTLIVGSGHGGPNNGTVTRGADSAMRILHMGVTHLVTSGGLEMMLYEFNRALSCRDNIEVDHAFLIGDADYNDFVHHAGVCQVGGVLVERDTGVHLFPMKVPSVGRLQPDRSSDEAMSRFERQFAQLLQRRRPDVFHTHMTKSTVELLAIRIAKSYGIPVVMEHVQGPFKDEPQRHEILQAGASIADCVTAISSHAASAITVRDVDHIHSYLDTEAWSQELVSEREKKEWWDQLQIDSESFLFTYPTRIHPRKNPGLLIQSLDLLRRRGLGDVAHVIIVGQTRERFADFKAKLEAMVSDLGLVGRVHFVDEVSRERLRALLSISKSVVYPSVNEGCGRSHLEGMLVGCCPIVSDDGGLTEHVKHEVNGLAFKCNSANDLADAMASILRDEELRQRLVTAGESIRSELSLDDYTDKHIEIYKSLVAKTQNRGMQRH